LLGPAWGELDEAPRQAHLQGERLCLCGKFRIRRGANWLGRLVAMIVGLPAAGEAVATRLSVLRTAGGEKWIRSFAGAKVLTTQTAAADGTLRERFGMFEISCRLDVDRAAIRYRQVGAALRLGRLRLALPRRLWPLVEGVETAQGPLATHVSVRITAPFCGHLISYDGVVKREGE
jgi:hypothetical protein